MRTPDNIHFSIRDYFYPKQSENQKSVQESQENIESSQFSQTRNATCESNKISGLSSKISRLEVQIDRFHSADEKIKKIQRIAVILCTSALGTGIILAAKKISFSAKFMAGAAPYLSIALFALAIGFVLYDQHKYKKSLLDKPSNIASPSANVTLKQMNEEIKPPSDEAALKVDLGNSQDQEIHIEAKSTVESDSLVDVADELEESSNEISPDAMAFYFS